MFYSKQRGSALIVSIFIITVMAVMAAAMIKIDWSSQDTTSREVFATRAWYAAHSGNEYMLSKLFPLGETSSKPEYCKDYTGELEPSLFDCHALILTCTKHEYGGAETQKYKYQLEATATCGTGAFETTRTQETWAKDLANNE
ncbi:hypothetical protein C9I98_25250 [Photobacterium sanctipauli]|uniref:MSHA biogenesis protein MshP n=1 Tax=Photobacterium sanctipauli TaxID=1342794 RepID=A0A2T3N9K9_9GAMM|nr:hypothetical protein [Photobacterium sanctipauli]PSW10216.1 hypothetical protein C9I98_25250 [Photobacterium sanctipauli]